MKAYASIQTAANGVVYSVRYLLTNAELEGLQAAGLVPMNASEVVGLQPLVDGLVASYERDCYRAAGGITQ